MNDTGYTEGDSQILKIIIWIIISSGGVGKTYLAQTIQAIAQILGVDIHLASQDRGNQAIKHAIATANIIDPKANAEDARRIVSKVQNREIFCIDVGANAATEESDPLAFGKALNFEAASRGAKLIAVVPTAPLKINGGPTATTTAGDLLNEEISVHLVKNHQNLSQEFGKMEVIDNVDISELPYMPSGLLALIRRRKNSFADPYLDPEPGYGLAGNLIGNWLAEAAKMPLMSEIFGDKISEMVLPKELKPQPLAYTLERLSHVTDKAIDANAQVSLAEKQMLSAPDSDLALAAACRKWRHAHAVYQEAIRD